MNLSDPSLKNPVWSALEESHKKWCKEFNGVKFYDPEICPFGAFKNESDTALAVNEYAKLTDKFFLVSENLNPVFDSTLIRLENKIEGCQMVLNHLKPIEITEEIIPLNDNHIDEIYNLVWLVMPGYYKKRSFEMGDFYGIFKNDKLVSIVGQRMQTYRWIEVSAVVTHPDFTRQGLAKQLTAYVTKEVLKQGKHAILHTTKGNPAIGLYQKLGYQLTRDMNWWLFSIKDKH